MAKEKAKTIANKDEKLQVDTNSSVPESVPVDGEVKESNVRVENDVNLELLFA